MAASAYVSEDAHIKESVTFLFGIRMVAVALVNWDGFLQHILELNRKKTGSPFLNMTTPVIFEAIIFFQRLSVFNDGLHKRTLILSQDDHTGKWIGFHALRLHKEWKQLFRKSPFTKFSKAMVSDMHLDLSICELQVFST